MIHWLSANANAATLKKLDKYLFFFISIICIYNIFYAMYALTSYSVTSWKWDTGESPVLPSYSSANFGVFPQSNPQDPTAVCGNMWSCDPSSCKVETQTVPRTDRYQKTRICPKNPLIKIRVCFLFFWFFSLLPASLHTNCCTDFWEIRSKDRTKWLSDCQLRWRALQRVSFFYFMRNKNDKWWELCENTGVWKG